jgi:DNA mismatch repair protein MutS2
MAAPDQSRASAQDGAWSTGGLDLELVRALFERLAVTPLGRRAVRDLAPREDAQCRAAYARQAELAAVARAGSTPPLGGASDPRPALEAARSFRRPLERGELVDLQTFLRAVERLRDWIEARGDELPACLTLVRAAPDLTAVTALLARTVDERGDVLSSASPALSRLRSEAAALDAHISAALDQLCAAATLRVHLADNVVHRRAGRRVLAVKARSAGRVPGLVHDRSQSGESVFVEPRETLELGNRLTAVEAEARAEEQRLLVELTRALLDQAGRVT